MVKFSNAPVVAALSVPYWHQSVLKRCVSNCAPNAVKSQKMNVFFAQKSMGSFPPNHRATTAKHKKVEGTPTRNGKDYLGCYHTIQKKETIVQRKYNLGRRISVPKTAGAAQLKSLATEKRKQSRKETPRLSCPRLRGHYFYYSHTSSWW